MKKIEMQEMLNYSGGSKFWDGFCVGVGAMSIVGSFLKLTPVGAVLLGAADVGCLIYGASQL